MYLYFALYNLCTRHKHIHIKTNLSYAQLTYSNKSGIGGILKGLGLKGKPSSKVNDSDSDLQISSEHTTNREYKSRNTFPTISVQKNDKKPPNRAGKFVCYSSYYDLLHVMHKICSFYIFN